jgi:ssDNA-binding Zn-finger/Zn-ribbon topoisomerase 1
MIHLCPKCGGRLRLTFATKIGTAYYKCFNKDCKGKISSRTAYLAEIKEAKKEHQVKKAANAILALHNTG